MTTATNAAATIVTAVKLVASSTSLREMTIVPSASFTVSDVIDLLNKNQAFVSGKQIIKPLPAPAEGSIVLASIVQSKNEQTQSVWQEEKAGK